jgi:hypothetical protein
VNFYFIHHKGTTDYFTVIVPGSGLSSAVTDLKPMSGPGGPATVTNVSGYFGLTFAAADLGYGLNLFYYFRADPVTGFTKFGTLTPALLGSSADLFDLGISGHNALTFTGTDVGYGVNQLYFNRLDPITGFTILGTLNPLTGKPSDIANLGSVYSTLDYVPGDVGFGAGDFYTTGAVNPTWQSVSFAAIADRAISHGLLQRHTDRQFRPAHRAHGCARLGGRGLDRQRRRRSLHRHARRARPHHPAGDAGRPVRTACSRL